MTNISGSLHVLGIELNPFSDNAVNQQEFNGNGIRITNPDTSAQSYTILSFYQFFDSSATFSNNVFFSVDAGNFSYAKLQYWIGRDDYNHPSAFPSYVYYFEEECLWDASMPSAFPGAPILMAEGWNQYVRTSTEEFYPTGTNYLNYAPISTNHINNSTASKPKYNSTSQTINFTKPIIASSQNETHVRGIAYLL